MLTAIDHLIDSGKTNPSKIAVLGGSHGGFLTTHLIGQVDDLHSNRTLMDKGKKFSLIVRRLMYYSFPMENVGEKRVYFAIYKIYLVPVLPYIYIYICIFHFQRNKR